MSFPYYLFFTFIGIKDFKYVFITCSTFTAHQGVTSLTLQDKKWPSNYLNKLKLGLLIIICFNVCIKGDMFIWGATPAQSLCVCLDLGLSLALLGLPYGTNTPQLWVFPDIGLDKWNDHLSRTWKIHQILTLIFNYKYIFN